MRVYLYAVLFVLVPAFANAMTLEQAVGWQFPEATYETARTDMAYAEGLKKVVGPKRANTVKLSGPADLNQNDTEYILESDVVADETAFTVKASHVTLNLNGHKVIYNNTSNKGGGVIQTDWNNPRDFVLINGEIEQGPGGGSGDAYGKGPNPVFLLSVDPVELAGLKISYWGDNLAGIFVYRAHKGDDIHNNEIIDKGTVVTDRHSGVAVVRVNGAGVVVRHNVIRGARQIGIRSLQKSEIHHNEVHVDSQVTNSTAIACAAGEVHHNKIVGRGVHPIGIWPGTGTKVYTNYVDVQNTKPGDEFGSTGSACVRFGWGKTQDVDIEGNLFVVKAEKDFFKKTFVSNKYPDSWGRAVFVGLGEGQKALFKNNIIIAYNQGNGAKAAAVGLVFNNKSSGLVFEENLIASNWGNVLLSDLYGHCEGYPLFKDNVMAKLDGGKDYHTIRGQYDKFVSTGRFLNNQYMDGAAQDDVKIDTGNQALQEIIYCRAVTLKAGPQCSGEAYTVNVVDQMKNVIWSVGGKCGEETKVDVPYLLFTNRDGNTLGREMEKKAPGGWGLLVQHKDKTFEVSLPQEGVDSVDLPF
ncbi:hypothetical protein [uncultured Pseudodesulfovibrio sp.]|uniref:hypothetical protein n=1 Tax=uncultured Pseudodesulfovibrio sp. TaxID=2035858 RepID=UPI0029C8A488|nr:hypothetical protein [uncultured Pseudodesulfovibrio sp.]